MSKIENPAAFPLNPTNDPTPGAFCPEPGMTLRDWFAGQALIGLMSNSTHDHCPLFGDGVPFARDAYIVADAMLAERAKGGEA